MNADDIINITYVHQWLGGQYRAINMIYEMYSRLSCRSARSNSVIFAPSISPFCLCLYRTFVSIQILYFINIIIYESGSSAHVLL